ncbi:hypothetical protein GGI42DRAFT_348121 [Trichoderma sp. SZMC 28013]
MSLPGSQPALGPNRSRSSHGLLPHPHPIQGVLWAWLGALYNSIEAGFSASAPAIPLAQPTPTVLPPSTSHFHFSLPLPLPTSTSTSTSTLAFTPSFYFYCDLTLHSTPASASAAASAPARAPDLILNRDIPPLHFGRDADPSLNQAFHPDGYGFTTPAPLKFNLGDVKQNPNLTQLQPPLFTLLESVSVTRESNRQPYSVPCRRWTSDSSPIRQLLPAILPWPGTS